MLKPTAFRPLLLFLALAHCALSAAPATPPKIGDFAPNFTLRTLDDRPIALRALAAQKPVVLVVLRGWPGYQCPICTKQVQDFAGHAGEFRQRGAQVLMVYPGPADSLKAHAAEFLQNKEWPADFLLVLDPDYTFTHAYGLRWDAKNETAHPATFVIQRDGRITFAQISTSHGGRPAAAQVLSALK